MNMQLMMARARLNHRSGAGGARRWWRLKMTAEIVPNCNVSIFEMTMSASSGGANLATGGLAAASSTYSSGFVASYAFDGNSTTRWAANGSDSLPYMLSYQLVTAAYINQITIRAKLAGYDNYATAFTIQSSANSTTGLDGTWNDEWSVSGQTGWTDNQIRTFTRP